jgi:hypothetical protein
MEHLKNVTIIVGNLAHLMYGYVKEFRSNGSGFEDFSDEAILYSLLEYSKFPRNFTKGERIIYIHGKCLEYEGKPHIYVSVEFDEQYDCFIVLHPQKSNNSLPF